jgi:deazaflavin-dependent oxidoreductase (nitroreductase family)
MNRQIQEALERGGVVDITTMGRKTRRPRRIEIWFHNFDGDLYITGRPGRRDWYANLEADPHFTLHLKEDVEADLSATARPVTDPARREAVLRWILTERFRLSPGKVERDLPLWMSDSPLVQVTIEG